MPSGRCQRPIALGDVFRVWEYLEADELAEAGEAEDSVEVGRVAPIVRVDFVPPAAAAQ